MDKATDLGKLFLLALAVVIPAPWYLARVSAIDSATGVLTFLVLLILCLVSLLAVSFCQYHVLRCAWAVLLTSSAVVVESYRGIMGSFLSYDAYVSILQAAAFVDDAWSQFAAHMAKPMLIGTLLLAGILLPPHTSFSRSKPATIACIAMPVVFVLTLSVFLYFRGGAGVKGLPSPIVALPYAIVRSYEYVEFDRGKRESVSILQQVDSDPVDIILIIDESVRGDYLDINAPKGVSSGLTGSDGAVHNFALAASATNCSGGSNVILRFGGTRENYLQSMHSRPSIWAYARAAGLRTVYLDAQRTGGRLQNFMYSEELEEIDLLHQFGKTKLVHRDMEMAELIVKLTNNDVAELILANKIGAHFPVHDKYPDAYMRFTPVVKRGNLTDISDTGDRPDFEGDWERYRNAYRNTLIWNVGEFFNIILAGADLENSFLVYTSDHGQDFHEDGSPGLGLHCSSSPSPNEGLVPLVLITEHPKWAKLAAAWSATGTV